MSKKGKKGKIGNKLFKKLETHGNTSKIGKGCQVCMTTNFEDLKQGDVVLWVRKVRLKNKFYNKSLNYELFGVESKC